MNIYIIITVICILLIILLVCKKIYDNFDNNWTDKIDGIVYINLENREDRKKVLLQELTKQDSELQELILHLPL